MSILSAFTATHAWMALYFAAVGASFGIVHGLARYRNLMLYRRLRQLSNTDPLTGLHNRRFLMESLRREYERARRYRSDLALLMIDIDHFKQFNDLHGHPAGDALLQTCAGRLCGLARRTDLVARVGGEEFMILMPGTNLAMAAHLAERLRRDIEAFPFADRDTQPSGRLTVSIGCAQMDQQNDGSLEDFLKTVDDCLYHAKNCGRNQIWF